jgi:hypothetical protein
MKFTLGPFLDEYIGSRQDAAQNPAQHDAAYLSIGLSENYTGSSENADTLIPVGAGAYFEEGGLGDEGVEPSTC